MKKRMTSLFLALTMCLTLLPAPVLAADAEPDASQTERSVLSGEEEKTPADAGGTKDIYVLSDDTAVSDPVAVSEDGQTAYADDEALKTALSTLSKQNISLSLKLLKDADAGSVTIGWNSSLTLDLNGKTLTGSIQVGSGGLTAPATLTIRDSGTAGTFNGSISAYTNAVLNIEGGTFTYSGDPNFYYSAMTENPKQDGRAAVVIWNSKNNPVSGTISGGTFSATGENAYGIYFCQDVPLKLTGGTFTSLRSENSGLASQLEDGYRFVKDGQPVKRADLADKDLTGTVSVEQCTSHDYGTAKNCIDCNLRNPDSMEAAIGGTRYDTLSDALSALEDGDTLTLLTDLTLTDALTLDKSVALDLNGRTLSRDAAPVLNVAAQNVTVKDSSTGRTGCINFTGTAYSTDCAAQVAEGASLSVTGGTFTGGLTVAEGGAAILSGGTYSRTYSAPVINQNEGGSVNALLPDGYAFQGKNGILDGSGPINGYNEQWAEVILHACTYDGKDSAGEPNGKCACGRSCPHMDMDLSTGICKTCGMSKAVKVGDAFYDTLDEALKAAENLQSGTVTLLKNIYKPYGEGGLSAEGGTFTLDLNGKTISASNNAGGTLDVAGANVTLVNGTLKNRQDNVTGCAAATVKSGSLTIGSGMTLNSLTIQIPDSNSEKLPAVIVSGGSLSVLSGAVLNGGISISGDGNAVLSGGTIHSGRNDTTDPCPIIDGVTPRSVLADGYAFTDENGGLLDGSAALTADTVSITAHPVHDQVDESTGKCACGAELAAGVTADGQTTYYEQFTDAAAAVSVSGGTIKLLKDYGSDSSYFNLKNFGNRAVTIDLNGKTLYAVSWSGMSNAALTVQNGTFQINSNSLRIVSGGSLALENADIFGTVNVTGGRLSVKGQSTVSSLKFTSGKISLSGGNFKTIDAGSGRCIGDLLENGYSYKRLPNGEWVTAEQLLASVHNDVKQPYVAASEVQAVDIPDSLIMNYGESSVIHATARVVSGGGYADYQWYRATDTGWEKVEGAAELSYTVSGLSCGSHEFRCVATGADGASVLSNPITVTVNPVDISGATVTVVNADRLTYSGAEQTADVQVKLGETVLSAEDYTVSGNTGTAAGEYTLTVSGRRNYGGTAEGRWTIKPARLTIADVTVPEKTYDGTQTAVITGVTFNGLVGGEALTIDTDYTVTGTYDHPFAGARQVEAAVTLNASVTNYTFGGNSSTVFRKDNCMISKAAVAAPVPVELTITNGVTKSYTVALPELPRLEAPMDYGNQWWYLTAPVQLSEGYAGTAYINDADKTLTLRITATGSTVGSIGRAEVDVTTDSFEDILLTVNINAADKLVPTGTPTLSRNELTYGEALSAITLTNDTAIAGRFEWDTPETVPNAGTFEAEWRFIPDDEEIFAAASGTASITVKKAALTGEPEIAPVTQSGKTFADIQITKPNDWPDGSFAWSDGDGNAMNPADTVQANTAYIWKFTPADANYSEAAGNVTLYRVSSSGGGSSGGSSAPGYKPSVTPSENGTTTVSSTSPKKGDTVRITPEPADGNEVSRVIVTDRNGKTIEVKANADGTYSFVQPDSAVTIKVEYQPKQTAETDFSDVSAAHFAYNAIKWAAEKGITGGVGSGLFAPDRHCTRAQIVTFLWSAAGSPEPKTSSSFADVPADAYYAKAVAWAVENGVTAGVSETAFAPDDTCTRAQAVTFLARAMNGRADGKADFADVPADSWYADAVAWAVENAVTNGVSETLFAPDDICTRVQIVTFLYRLYGGK